MDKDLPFWYWTLNDRVQSWWRIEVIRWRDRRDATTAPHQAPHKGGLLHHGPWTFSPAGKTQRVYLGFPVPTGCLTPWRAGSLYVQPGDRGAPEVAPEQRGRKRTRNKESWKRNKCWDKSSATPIMVLQILKGSMILYAQILNKLNLRERKKVDQNIILAGTPSWRMKRESVCVCLSSQQYLLSHIYSCQKCSETERRSWYLCWSRSLWADTFEKQDSRPRFRWIKSFPAMETHYTRKDTKRKYLQNELSIRKMATVLYPEWCRANGYRAVKENVYCIFKLYLQASTATASTWIKKTNVSHVQNMKTFKEQTMKPIFGEKKNQKQKKKPTTQSEQDNHFQAITFDLEAVCSSI